ncbi:MAG: 5-(carboxyamino)imidazole ribonucleotide synthase [Gammaproteobacteria bacterium]|nr:5-(carboxyamino)imidazole ribonucleotide synthase [Gammaproteobacteria bacterium]
MKVGILGGGQLARMLALAGHPLGIETTVLCPVEDASAAAVTRHLHGSLIDHRLLGVLADAVDVVTYEFENVPVESLQVLDGRTVVQPPPRALATGQDRLAEKMLFRRLSIPTADFHPVERDADVAAAISALGLPVLLKTRREGYDGKGQVLLRTAGDAAGALERIGGGPGVAESFVTFEREVSIIAVRDVRGRLLFYPLSENTHEGGILKVAVSRPGDPMQARAEDYGRRLMEQLDYVGVLALELFQVGDALLANEFAPRVHNSGHWTIEGAETSQFENHLRAVVGLELGDTGALGLTAMVNCIGALPALADVMAVPGAHMHDYGKAPRPGRKVGHITLRAADPGALEFRLHEALRLAAAGEQAGTS